MFVIGTAGHVDHGKSTLIQALTGIDPDRLAEEKAREMTIDLGFAWLQLGAGESEEEIGVVDVPGHRDFIENMLAGVGGVDLAILVIAADEGVMPQTREHLAILDLLEVKGGIVALTKVDLVEDEEWLDLVEMDIAEVLEGTALANAPILPVSAKTGAGLPALKQQIHTQLQTTPPKQDEGRPRLPIDRVFTLTGFGTVVTGTLIGGRLKLGDAVAILPGTVTGRVRGLQTHRTKRDIAQPGSRVAVNLTGVDRDEVARGQIITLAGAVRETTLLDVHYRHLPDLDFPLKHNTEVKFFVGSAEVVARTRVLGAKQIEPGETGFVQLALRDPVAAVRGDRFILRRPSPGQTMGGGRVLDPNPGRQHRRFKSAVIARLQTLLQGTPAELLLQALQRNEPATESEVTKRAGLDSETAKGAWAELTDSKQIVVVGKQVISNIKWQALMDEVTVSLNGFHQSSPLRLGMSREELRSRLKVPAFLFNQLLSDHPNIEERQAVVAVAGHGVVFSAEQEKKVAELMKGMENAGINTPTVKQNKALVGDDVYFALLDLGQLQPISDDVVYTQTQYTAVRDQIIGYLTQHNTITASQVRDLLDTSRKYAIAWLEHLDQQKITRRVGDERELIRKY